MYLGLDIGTSAVKAVLCDSRQVIVAQADVSLSVCRPAPLCSEQAPADWWQAVLTALGRLREENAAALAAVTSIGLVGQMHGVVLLDKKGEVLRPAILWNDGRSAAECGELESAVANFRELSGNIAMPGFSAPKLLWVAKNEPEIFSRVAMVLLPKDYIRYCLTGDYVTDMSDAAGSLWLDVAKRDWSDILLAACGLSREQMPRLCEGNAVSGHVKPGLAAACGLGKNVMVAGGAGDNAGGAVGIGAVAPGRAFLSLGTSGVLFLCTEKYSPNQANAVHSFCHCLPNVWHQMSVILSAGSCLSWVVRLTGAENETSLLAEAAKSAGQTRLLFLPYLSGERTPHNDAEARGVFFGLDHDSDRGCLARAVLEGVAFAFADGMDALLASGAEINHISLIGGGARSDLWGGILATVLERELKCHEGGEVGPAYGAARLAMLAAGAGSLEEICGVPKIIKTIKPDATMRDYYRNKLMRYRRLYTSLKYEYTA